MSENFTDKLLSHIINFFIFSPLEASMNLNPRSYWALMTHPQKICYCKSGEERKLSSNEMSEVLCNVYVLFNCLYVCSCFSLYLYCICCIEEALMLAIDQPLPPIENTDLPAAILRHPIYTRWTPPSVRLTADLISKTCKENLCPSIFWCGISGHMARWVGRLSFFCGTRPSIHGLCRRLIK